MNLGIALRRLAIILERLNKEDIVQHLLPKTIFLSISTLKRMFECYVMQRLLQSQLANVEGVRISIGTIRQRIREDKFQPRIPV